MAKGHRSKIKRERNLNNRELRPHAVHKYARVSDIKARIVLEQIKGKPVGAAMAILNHSPRYAASLIEKVLKSAIANAENNMGLDTEKLYVAAVFADRGPVMKRIQPRAKGRAYRIEKKVSHISVILDEKKDRR